MAPQGRVKRIERALSELVEELASEAKGKLERHGYSVVMLESPRSSANRSIDLLASGGERRLHVKVTLDAESLDQRDLGDLAGFARTIRSAPLVVCEYVGRIDVHDDVIYERGGVPAVSISTLDPLLRGDRSLYVIGRRANFYVRIDGEKLREKREELGLSLGRVADALGVSRKAVYEYERNAFDVEIEVAEKLVELFGEDITKPYRLFDEEEWPKLPRSLEPDNKLEKKVLEMLSPRGVTYHAKKTFADVLMTTRSKRLIITIEHSKSSSTIEEKINELRKLRGMDDICRVVVSRKESASENEILYVTEDTMDKLKTLLDEEEL